MPPSIPVARRGETCVQRYDLTVMPYRAPLAIASDWTVDSMRAQLGDCIATIEPRHPARLPRYYAWRVTRGDLVLHGTATSIADAQRAAERAARVLNADGWPSAFCGGD